MSPSSTARCLGLMLLFGVTAAPLAAQDEPAPTAVRTAAEIVRAAGDAEWRDLDPENTVYFELPGGRVVMELAPGFAPEHARNIRALVRAGLFDGGGVIRSQDNYVAQWSVRPLPEGSAPPEGIATALPAEFEIASALASFTPLPDADVYAPEAGFTDGFPVGRDAAEGTAWLAHCYGMVGVARGTDPGSGSGAQLYAVTGHGPRHLDRNITLVGRVVMGMEHLSTLTRGTGAMGFYESQEEVVPIASARVAADLPPADRTGIQVLRTDGPSFTEFVLASRSRTEDFFLYTPHRIDLCNVRVPTRPVRPG